VLVSILLLTTVVLGSLRVPALLPFYPASRSSLFGIFVQFSHVVYISAVPTERLHTISISLEKNTEEGAERSG
jgi:hypothetical protein